jgi:hypothetical protein
MCNPNYQCKCYSTGMPVICPVHPWMGTYNEYMILTGMQNRQLSKPEPTKLALLDIYKMDPKMLVGNYMGKLNGT